MNRDIRPGLVSVIIPTFNCDRYVCEAVDSVLEQTYEPIEVIVIDDGSEDDTEMVLRKYGDGIRYIRKSNGGVSSARNVGLESARGEWLAFLDADDVWYREKIRHQITQLADSHVPLHSTNLELQRTHLDVPDFFLSTGFSRTFHTSAVLKNPAKAILRYHFPWLPATILHADLVHASNGFDEALSLYEDLSFLLGLAKGNAWMVSREILVKALRRDAGSQNLSNQRLTNPEKSYRNLIGIYRKVKRDQGYGLSTRWAARKKLLNTLSGLSNHYFGIDQEKSFAVLWQGAGDECSIRLFGKYFFRRVMQVTAR